MSGEKTAKHWRKRKQKHRKRDMSWTPFVRGKTIDVDDERINTKETWFNNKYQVFVYMLESQEGFPRMAHLSIKTHRRSFIRDWRDLQRIKNELCGTSSEGAELFPDEDRLTDIANQYHMWVLEPGYRFPFGFNDGRTVSTDPVVKEACLEIKNKLGLDPSLAKQRNLKPHHNADGCNKIGPVFLPYTNDLDEM